MSLKFILTESQYNKIVKNIISEKYTFDPEVEKIQKDLKDKYNLGKYGINKDGVDGLLGPLTKKAMTKEIDKNPTKKDDYEKLIKKHSDESDVEYDKESEKLMKDIDKPEKEVGELTPKSTSDVIIFISGLYEGGYKNVEQQKKLIEKGLKSDKKVFAFAWRETDEALKKLEEYPNASVVLFSRGTGFSDKFASKIKDKNNLYIVEPYRKAKGSIISAINFGVPRENVVLGGGTGSGLGLIPGGSRTPKEYAGHWPALTYIASVIS